MRINKKNSARYSWGDNCSRWHLVNSQHLSIIEELMPPKTKEKRHYHNFSEQFFQILGGTALFELEDKEIEVGAGSGMYILPQQKHSIRNDKSEDLQFIVISYPPAHEDRVDEPFNNKQEINLNGKIFRSIENADNGEVTSETLFHYRQNKNIIWATYQGGSILFGTLSGRRMVNNVLFFTYQHQNIDGEFMTGKCETTVEFVSGKLRLNENWEWTSGDYSKGKSVLEEISSVPA